MMNMTCRKLAELVAHGDACRLSLRQRFALKLHMRLCPPCRDYAKQLDKLGEMTCEDIEAKMSKDCCNQTLKRLEDSILEDCGLKDCRSQSAD